MFVSCLNFIHKLEDRLLSNTHPNLYRHVHVVCGFLDQLKSYRVFISSLSLGSFIVHWMNGIIFSHEICGFYNSHDSPGKKNESNCTLLWTMRREPGVFYCWFRIPYLYYVVLVLFTFQTSPLFCTDKVVRYFGSRNVHFFLSPKIQKCLSWKLRTTAIFSNLFIWATF